MGPLCLKQQNPFSSPRLAPFVQCYAPYTRCHSGAALVLSSGAVTSGCYIESAAYNPSLSPFHSAVVHGVTQGMSSYGEVRTAWRTVRLDA